jgi:hypothetical protein
LSPKTKQKFHVVEFDTFRKSKWKEMKNTHCLPNNQLERKCKMENF